jgi:carboxyl-terminal processing protease
MTRRLARGFVVFGVLLVLVSPAAAQGPSNCQRTGQNTYVRDVMRDLYYWYRMMPNVNPASYASPEALLEALRYRPIDSSYSYITSRASNEAFFSESQYIGYGFTTRLSGSEMHLLQVFPDSPGSEADMSRGDRIVEINGRSVADLIASGAINNAFGAATVGVVSRVVIQHRGEEERHERTLVKRIVTIPTVSLTRVFEVDGRKVGYLLFRNFVTPSFEALNEAFASLREAGATELVLDVRYNGGGLVDVAVHLASLIGGVVTEGRVFAEYRHNDRNADLDEALRFGASEHALTLERLFVITTRSSASASELIINGLRPHMPVVVVGDTTYGKPVGQYGITFCDKVLAPVSFKMVNADGQGDFFDGIPADCTAADDIEHDLGFADEASLGEALHYIRTGSCSSPPTEGALPQRARIRPERATGWQSVLNAH